MSDATKIEWTRGDDGTPGATWNPTVGCTKVSPGCDHCYALTLHERFHGKGSFDTVTLHPDRLDKPLHWRKPRRVFVNSMSDLFHADVPDDYIAKVFAVMALAEQHQFQLLTKRHGRMRSLLSSDLFRRRMYDALVALNYQWINDHRLSWPLPNVWIGVSVETQQWADIRVPALLDTPAAIRFLSCEPLLGPVTLKPQWLVPDALVCGGDRRAWTTADSAAMSELLRAATRRLAREDGGMKPAYVDWVIVGGESGPHARPMHPDWARALRDQCTAAGVPYFFKQFGEWAPDREAAGRADVLLLPNGEGTVWAHRADAEHLVRVGKKAAGRELDGRTWDQYPQAVTARTRETTGGHP